LQFIWVEIFKGSIATVIIYLLSYLIEKNSRWDLLIWGFQHKKNDFIAQGAANANAALFFLVCLITLVIDLSNLKEIPQDYSFWTWFIIMIIICIIYRKAYYILQKKLDKIDNTLSN